MPDNLKEKIIDIILEVAMAHYDGISPRDRVNAVKAGDKILVLFPDEAKYISKIPKKNSIPNAGLRAPDVADYPPPTGCGHSGAIKEPEIEELICETRWDMDKVMVAKINEIVKVINKIRGL